MNTKRGLFITVEGTDGSGKTTQLTRMGEYFASHNIDVLFTREPGGTAISEKIRGIILDKKNSEMDYMTEALLYAAARAQHVSQVIRPALERGKVVVCDRFIDSSIAYQGYGRELGESVAIINEYAIGQSVPDKTFWLDIMPEEGRRRIEKNDLDRLEVQGEDFYHKVYKGYLELQIEFPERIIRIDARRTPEEVEQELIGHLDQIMRTHYGL